MNARTGSSPCRGCRQREIGCHSHCEAYQQYDQMNKQRRDVHMLVLDADGMDATRDAQGMESHAGRKAGRIMKDKYRAIYQPRGAALEYSPLALNLYQGCPHGCKYCYVPGCLHRTPEFFHSNYAPRPGILDNVEADLREMSAAGDRRPVLLCFTCDPYPGDTYDSDTTRCVLEMFHYYNQPFQLLTKAGTRAVRDFKLYKPGDAYAVTLTCMNEEDSQKWEPGAAEPKNRILSLWSAKKMGITTWVSFEPVIDPEQVYQLYEASKKYVDLFKIGKMNHMDSSVDWRAFGLKIMKMCARDGKKFVIKDALAKHLRG